MRLIKLAFISAVVFFVIITGMSLFIPSSVRISKAINIKGGKEEIFPLVADRTAWQQWHPLFANDSMEHALQQHQITLTPVATNDSMITMQWQQAGRRPVINAWQLHTIPGADSTALQWYMDFDLPWYPWHKFGSLFYEKTYGVMMEQGLQNLQGVVHSQNVSKPF